MVSPPQSCLDYGLFTNLSIETERKEMVNQMASVSPTNPDSNKLNVINFTIKTAYTPSKAAGGSNASPVNASASAPANPAAPVQVAKN